MSRDRQGPRQPPLRLRGGKQLPRRPAAAPRSSLPETLAKRKTAPPVRKAGKHGSRPRVAVILAAGKGTRMKSERPKVLHEVGGRPLLAWVLGAAREAGCERLLVVVGHGAEAVRAAFPESDLEWIEQREQRGTGHALLQVADRIAEPAVLLVLSGDVPLVRPETLRTLLARAAGSWGAMAVAELAEPGALGRVQASPSGALLRIVEVADAQKDELALSQINAGLYALPAPEVFADLRRLRPDNAKRELYLTDALTAAAGRGEQIELFSLADPEEGLGVNDRADLARVHRLLVARRLVELLASGVTVLDPAHTVVDPSVEVGADTVIHPGVALLGRSAVGAGCTLAQGAWIRDTRLADGVVIEPYSVLDGAEVGPGCRVGPFARLRPGTVLAARSRVGNFVEVKNSRLGVGSKANHLAYLGDATVGAGANVGAGVITCNFDGVAKHPTEIGERAFLGSDTLLVAPVRVGEEATTAAGSVITKEVPAGALAVSRSKQKNLPGWNRRRGVRSEKGK